MDAAACIDVEPETVCDGVRVPADETHLWTAPDDICAGQPAAAALLSPDERAAAARFVNARAARSFAAGRVLARLALSRQCAVRPQDWAFAPGAYGRPFVVAPDEYRGMYFSLSHTEGLVACLSGRTACAAVDVERITPWDDLQHVAPTVLSEGEQHSIAALSGDAWVRRFFEYWTLKEACTKALGVGLARDFASISFRFDEACDITAQFAEEAGEAASGWLFRRLPLGPDWAGAVAVKTAVPAKWRLVHTVFTPELLARELARFA